MVADYAIISSEVTRSNYLQEYIVNLSAAGDDLEKMKQASRNTVDFYAERYEPEAEESPNSTSHGFYDLSKTSDLMSIVKKITNWYSDAADKDPDFVAKVIDNTLYTNCALHAESTPDVDLVELRQNVLEMYQPETFSKWNRQQVMSLIESMTAITRSLMTNGFIFSDIMRQSLRLKSETDKDLNFDTLGNLYEEYINTIKSMAYIRAVGADPEIVDYAYIFTSPSICIVPFNDLYKKAGVHMIQSEEEYDEMCDDFVEAFQSGDVETVNKVFSLYFDGVGYDVDLETLMQGYQNTLFDQQTGWSGFLKKLPTTPSLLINPDRVDYVKGLRKY